MDSFPRRSAPARRLRLILAVAAIAAAASIALPATASAATDRAARSHCLLSLPIVGCVVPGPHLPDSTLAGTPQEGQTLTCANNVLSIPVIGGLINALPKTWKFQANGSQVASGSSPLYTLTGNDVGKTITCSLSIGGTINVPIYGPFNISISSNPSGGKGPVTSLPLDNVTPPTISGTAQEGQTLTCNPGTWSVTPQSSSLEFVSGAQSLGTGPTLALTSAHVGKSITCRESVTRFERNSSAESAAKGPVTAKPADPGTGGGGNTGGGGTVNPPVSGPPVTNTQGTAPTNNALARRRALARKRAAAIKKCKTKFRKASQRRKRAACIKKARRRYRVA
jgi:hypothetical protein